MLQCETTLGLGTEEILGGGSFLQGRVSNEGKGNRQCLACGRLISFF